MSQVLATEDQVLALSPDAASSKAAKGLQAPAKWPSSGCNEAVAWGECQGSGSKPYQTQIDLGGPAFKCSCPSRKFPCKHGLALLLLRAAGQVPTQAEPPPWVQDWLAGRQEKAEKKEAKAAAIAAAPPPDPQVLARQQAQRDEKRWDKVASGMQDLQLWLQDMVRNGLANLSGDAQARQHWRTMAARMVDAQAPGMAARIQQTWELVDSHPQWARDMLVQLGHWQLLVDAVARREVLGAPTRADVMAALGWPMDKAEVQALGQAVSDDWCVVGLRQIEREGRLIERRVWLQGLHSGRIAWVLDYAQGGRGFETAWLPGQTYRGSLHFYPGRAPLRALAAVDMVLLGAGAGAELGEGLWADSLLQYGQRVAANPLQAVQPLWCGQARLQMVDGQWFALWPHNADAAALVPLALGDDEGWQLQAISGGAPMALFGEWEAGPQVGRWRVLSAWQQPAAAAGWAAIWQNRSEVL